METEADQEERFRRLWGGETTLFLRCTWSEVERQRKLECADASARCLDIKLGGLQKDRALAGCDATKAGRRRYRAIITEREERVGYWMYDRRTDKDMEAVNRDSLAEDELKYQEASEEVEAALREVKEAEQKLEAAVRKRVREEEDEKQDAKRQRQFESQQSEKRRQEQATRDQLKAARLAQKATEAAEEVAAGERAAAEARSAETFLETGELPEPDVGPDDANEMHPGASDSDSTHSEDERERKKRKRKQGKKARGRKEWQDNGYSEEEEEDYYSEEEYDDEARGQPHWGGRGKQGARWNSGDREEYERPMPPRRQRTWEQREQRRQQRQREQQQQQREQ